MTHQARPSRSTFAARYDLFMHTIRNQYNQGILKQGDILGSEESLCERFRLSRGSVRKGLAELEKDGILIRLKGKGTFITRSEIVHNNDCIKLALFTPNHEQDRISYLIDQYNLTNKSLPVKLILIPSGEYAATLEYLIDNGSAPDVVYISDKHYAQLREKDAFINIATSLEGFDSTRFYQKAMAPFTDNHNVYAMPFTLSPIILCYNKDMFYAADLPFPDGSWTWTDTLAVAQKLTSSQGVGKPARSYGFYLPTHINRWPIFLMQNMAKLTDEQGLPDLNNERIVKTVEYCANMMHRYKICPISSRDNSHNGQRLFLEGHIGMSLESFMGLNEYENTIFDIGIAAPMKERARATILITYGFSVLKTSPVIEEAMKVIDYLVTDNAQTYLKENCLSIPSVESVAQDRNILPRNVFGGDYYIFEDVLSYANTLDVLNSKWLRVLDEELVLVWNNLEQPIDGCNRAQKRALQIHTSTKYNELAQMR